MPKVTAAVPVYNVEGYLEKCAESVLAQTERDIELLLIDDGSTDGSGALCDRIAEGDPRVRVIHQENRGLGGARNTGIENARGEWIIFPDSDDWLEPETIERALGAAEDTGADMSLFAFRSVDEGGNTTGEFRESLPEGVPLDPHERRDLLLMAPNAWTKLYRTELFKRTGVRYPPRVWYEDIRTTSKLLPYCSSVAYTDYIGYNYLQRKGSIMNNGNLSRNREIIDAFDDILGWYREQGLFDEYRQELEYLTLFHLYLTASVRVARADPRHPLLKEFADYFKGRFPDCRKNPYLARLGRTKKLALRLTEHRLYGLLKLAFQLKG